MKAKSSNLYKVKISPELLSRGTGKSINRQEAVVYDFMPNILGNVFMVDDGLRRGVHFYGHCNAAYGPFDKEEAYRILAKQELGEGNFKAALEAYKRSLHTRTDFIHSMSLIQENALFSVAETERINEYIEKDFGELEQKLISEVVAQYNAFELDAYEAFLKEIRHLEKDAMQLNQIYFFGAKDLPHEDLSKIGDLETGKMLRDTYVKMHRYRNAAWISKEIGDFEAQEKYTKLIETEPEENQKLDKILKIIMEERNYRM